MFRVNEAIFGLSRVEYILHNKNWFAGSFCKSVKPGPGFLLNEYIILTLIKCLVLGISFCNTRICSRALSSFNSFETSFLPICNCFLQNSVTLRFWTNMRIVSWLPQMTKIVFFVIKIFHHSIYKGQFKMWLVHNESSSDK